MRSFRKSIVAAVGACLAFSSVAVALTAAPASATVVTCNSSTKTWAALYPNLFGNPSWQNGSGATYCFGNKGLNVNIPYNQTEVFCAGNNSGVVSYIDLSYGNGAVVSHTFWTDTSYAVYNGTYTQGPPEVYYPGEPTPDTIVVTAVQINGWSGSAGC
jgi:hypothetical protein